MSEKTESISKGDGTVTSQPGGRQNESLAKQLGRKEARVVSKLDWNLMTLFFVLYMLAFLDRGNIGNARIAGLQEDFHLDGDRYQWLINIPYIAYVISEFGILLWKIFPPHIVGATVVFGWFLLGVFEACYGPGIIYLLSFFYLRHEIGFRCGIFASAAPLASTFAGALAYGITSGHSHLASWRLLFLVEGLPTVLLAIAAFYFIPDSPEKARFLDAEEKGIVKSRAIRQVGMGAANARIGAFRLKDIGAVLIDIKAWLCAFMYFSGNVCYSILPVFLPTILNDMGYTSINAQGLSAPPSFTAFLCALITTWVADKTQQRCFVLFVTSAVGGTGYIILATVETAGVRYFATFLASAGVFSTIPNILALALNNQGSDTRRGTSLVLINSIGQTGPFLGTNIFPTRQSPRYIEGMSICAAFMFFSALLALIQRYLLVWENAKLDRKYGTSVTKGRSDFLAPEDIALENYGSQYRFIL
ncbi:MFS general substrate transporter [Xylaria digitata]|nr:MFS general substrate transporter [Xylaria digitata]